MKFHQNEFSSNSSKLEYYKKKVIDSYIQTGFGIDKS